MSLITFEYGTCVAKSKALVFELGLERVVHWFPITPRKDLMCGILHADVVCAEFGNSWLSSGVIYEALVMGKPLVGYRDDELYRDQYPRLYPIMNARTPESICARFEEYLADPATHRANGERGRIWYHDFVVEPVLERYVSYIQRRGAELGAAAE